MGRQRMSQAFGRDAGSAVSPLPEGLSLGSCPVPRWSPVVCRRSDPCPAGRRDRGPVRAPRRQDPQLLPAPARLARGGGGRRPDDVHECVPRARPRRRAGGRVGLAVQDRRERVPLPPPLLVAPRPDREPERLRRDRGGRPRPEPAARRADRDRGCARLDAGAAAARDSSARVAGPLLPGDLGGAGALAVGRRDVDLPRPALARPGARAARPDQEAEAQGPPPRVAHDRRRHPRRRREDAARRERCGQGDRHGSCRHRRRNRGERDPEARGSLAEAGSGNRSDRAERECARSCRHRIRTVPQRPTRTQR